MDIQDFMIMCPAANSFAQAMDWTAEVYRAAGKLMAEARPGDASEIVADEYRGWLRSLFTDLAGGAGASDAELLGRQLALLYDGAAVAARMDRDRGAAASALVSAVEALLEAAISPTRLNRPGGRHRQGLADRPARQGR